jgi:hypothetical protein
MKILGKEEAQAVVVAPKAGTKTLQEEDSKSSSWVVAKRKLIEYISDSSCEEPCSNRASEMMTRVINGIGWDPCPGLSFLRINEERRFS